MQLKAIPIYTDKTKKRNCQLLNKVKYWNFVINNKFSRFAEEYI